MNDRSDNADLLTPAVRSYLSDKAVQTAVHYLLGVKQHAVPSDLTLPELDDYFAARAEAEAIKSEWAMCVFGLWQQIWGDRLAGWTPANLGEAVAAEQSVTPQACWMNEDFSIWHSKSGHNLYTAFQMRPGSSSIAFSLEARGKQLIKELDGFHWHKDEDWDCWLVYTIQQSPADFDFSLNELTSAAGRAIQAVTALISAKA